MNKTNCGVIHVVATCEDCEWSETGYLNGVRKAYYHAKKTGHTVTVETGNAWIYNPKVRQSKE